MSFAQCKARNAITTVFVCMYVWIQTGGYLNPLAEEPSVRALVAEMPALRNARPGCVEHLL